MTPEEARHFAQQGLEILKVTGEGFSLLAWYTATLVNALAWPAVLIGIAWILRKQIKDLLDGIRELAFEYKGVKGSLRIEKYLNEFAKKVPDAEQKIRTAGVGVPAKAILTATATVTSALGAKAQALRDSMGRDLEHLEKLSNVAAAAPVDAMIESWAVLKKNVVETAKLHGFEPTGGSSSEVKQALFYLTIRVLNSQDTMIGVYSLATAMQKVEQKPDAEVSVRDAQDFVRYCMAIVADLSFDVDKVITSEAKD